MLGPVHLVVDRDDAVRAVDAIDPRRSRAAPPPHDLDLVVGADDVAPDAEAVAVTSDPHRAVLGGVDSGDLVASISATKSGWRIWPPATVPSLASIREEPRVVVDGRSCRRCRRRISRLRRDVPSKRVRVMPSGCAILCSQARSNELWLQQLDDACRDHVTDAAVVELSARPAVTCDFVRRRQEESRNRACEIDAHLHRRRS